MKYEKKEKRRLERFQYYDFTGIENHLKKMAARGWLLSGQGSSFWTYKKIQPQDLTFAVTYLPDLSDFDPQPTDGQLLCYELCEAAGWTLAAQWNKMQIFYTADPGPVPLETDPHTRLETVAKTMRRILVPNLLAIFLLIAIQFGNFFMQLENNPADTLSSPVTLMIPVMFGLLLATNIIEALPYWNWLRKSRRSVAEGGGILPSRGSYRFLSGFLLSASLLCLLYMFTGQKLTMGSWLLTCIIIALPTVLVTWIALSVKDHLKELKASRRKNQVITISTAVIGTMAAMGFIMFATIMSAMTGVFSLTDSSNVETVDIPMADGSIYSWELHKDELPLYIQDLPGMEDTEYEFYSFEDRHQQTVLASFRDIRQDAPPSHDAKDVPEFRYELTDTRFSSLHEYFLDHLLHSERANLRGDEWIRQDMDSSAAPVSQIWRLYTHGDARNWWIISGKGPDGRFRIAELTFYWEPTRQQLSAAAEKLFIS